MGNSGDLDVSLSVPAHTRELVTRQVLEHTVEGHFTRRVRGGGIPYNGRYGEASPERGTFLGWRFEIAELPLNFKYLVYY